MDERNDRNTDAVLRILDANANRCAEGLRVVEEIARFAVGDESITAKLKEMRHAVRSGVRAFTSASYRFRDSREDIGRTLTTDSELLRGSLGAVARANFARAQEALRVIEEFGKLVNAAAAERFKALRFELYTIERRFLGAGAASIKLPAAPFLYAILDRSVVASPDVAAAAASLVAGGVDMIQYRAKEVSTDERRRDLHAVVGAAAGTSIPVIVNDDPELALETGADGVHLGAGDVPPVEARSILGPDRIIGLTVHTIEEIGRAPLDRIDYIAVGAIFASPTKPSAPVAGLGLLDAARGSVSRPIVAIGGIDVETVERVLDHGADGVALVSALLAGDTGKNCFTFRKIIDTRRTAAG